MPPFHILKAVLHCVRVSSVAVEGFKAILSADVCMCVCVLIFLSRKYRIIFISRVLKFHDDTEFIFIILWAL